MMTKKNILLFGLILSFGFSFGQTKKELEEKVIRQQKTIDSLQAVADNWENVVENRNRTIKFLREDTADLNDDIQQLYIKIRVKNQELVNLRNQAKTGTAKMFGISNNRNTFRVPEGKYWIINQFISDYLADLKADSTGNMKGTQVCVFLKSLNDEVLTDHEKGIYGPMLFSSLHPEYTINYPLVFTSDTKFQFVILQGEFDKMELYTGKVYFTFWEKEN